MAFNLCIDTIQDAKPNDATSNAIKTQCGGNDNSRGSKNQGRAGDSVTSQVKKSPGITKKEPPNEICVESEPADGKDNVSVDMTMSVSLQGQKLLVQDGIRSKVFKIVKFLQKGPHHGYSTDENTVCGVLLKYCHVNETPRRWWRNNLPNVVRCHTNHRNNCIKSMRLKYQSKWGRLFRANTPVLHLSHTFPPLQSIYTKKESYFEEEG